MVNKTTKYEQKQFERFARRENERRERFNRLSRQDPLYDMYEPWMHALTNLAREFALIDKEVVRAYLKNQKSVRNEEKSMKRIILFTDEELDDMIHGCEIEHRVDGQVLYFMSKEHFAQMVGANEAYEPDDDTGDTE